MVWGLRSVLQIRVPCLICAVAVVALTGCQTSLPQTASPSVLTTTQLEDIEVNFSSYRPPPPKRTINEEKGILEALGMEHPTACSGDSFYKTEVSNFEDLESNYSRVQALKAQARKAFKYGDMPAVFENLNDAASFTGDDSNAAGGVRFMNAIYSSMLGDTEAASFSYSLGVGDYDSAGLYSFNVAQSAFHKREVSAVLVYGEGRYREAEIRLREIKEILSLGQGQFAGSSYATSDEEMDDLIASSPALFSRFLFPHLDTYLVNYLIALSISNQGREAEAEAYLWTSMWGVEDSIDLAWILDALASVLMQQGRYDDAEWISRRAAEFFHSRCAPGQYFIVSRAYLTHAYALSAQGNWEEALKWFERVSQDGFSNGGSVNQHLTLTRGLALSRMLTGRYEEARGDFAIAISGLSNATSVESEDLAELRAFSAVNELLAVGDAASRRAAEAAMVAYLSLGLSPDAAGAEQLRQQRLEILSQLFFTRDFDQTPAETSFLFAQIGQTGAVQSALFAGAQRSEELDPELNVLIRKYQDVSARLNELSRVYSTQASFTNTRAQLPASFEVDREIQELSVAKTTAFAEIQARFPDFANATKLRLIDAKEVSENLGSDEALVVVRSFSDAALVWVVTPNGEVLSHQAKIGEKQVAILVERLRRSVDPGHISSLSDIPDFDLATSYRLYSQLFAPLQDTMSQYARLGFVLEGGLARLPLSLLVLRPPADLQDDSLLFDRYREVQWFGADHAISILPSVASYLDLKTRSDAASAAQQPFLGIGDPFFSTDQARAHAEDSNIASRGFRAVSFRALSKTRDIDSAVLSTLPRLADTRLELRSIADSLSVDPDQVLYLGEKASERTVKSLDLTQASIISFATHGLAAGDLNGLTEPALALSSPYVTGDKDSDGLLGLGEILGLKLNADWVVLSACNTAADDGSGSEAVSGLGRAFFYAGAKSILVSHWPVHSLATTELMSRLFATYSTRDQIYRSVALQDARLHLLRNAVFEESDGTPLYSYAHPIFWAPFILVGNG